MDDWGVQRQKLREAFRLVAEAHPDFVSDAYELLEVNEDVLALETMCDNLYESGLGVPAKAYKLFAEVGAARNVDGVNWEMLAPRVVPSKS